MGKSVLKDYQTRKNGWRLNLIGLPGENHLPNIRENRTRTRADEADGTLLLPALVPSGYFTGQGESPAWTYFERK
jgi:hypothetical protein